MRNKFRLLLLTRYGSSIFFALSYLFLFCSIFLGSKISENSVSRKIYYITILITFFFALGGNYFSVRNKEFGIIFQGIPVYFTTGVVFLMFFFSSKDFFYSNPVGGFNLSFVEISVLCFVLGIYGLIQVDCLKKMKLIIKVRMKDYYPVLLLLLISLLVGYFVIPDQPRWDSATILRETHEKVNPSNIFDYMSTSIAGHTSQFYVVANCILGYIFENEVLALIISHVSLYILSIVAIYRIVMMISKENSKKASFVIASIWAFSPYVLGMIGYYSYDQWLIYIFPIIVSAYMHREWFWFILFSTIACFTKELFIVSFFGLCIGMIIMEMYDKKPLKCLVFERRWIWSVIVGISWLVFYLHLSKVKPSSVVYSFFDTITTITNIKVFYILNFNWLLFILAIIGLIMCISMKQRDVLNICIPLLICDFFTFLPYAVISTGSMPRYMDAHVGCMYIIVIICFSRIACYKKRIVFSLGLSVSLLMLISSFRMIDPISKFSFMQNDYGNSKLITTTEELGDGIVYNSEYIHFDKALNKAIEGCESGTLFFPEVHEGILYNFEGKYAGIYLGDEAIEYYRNGKRWVLPDEKCKRITMFSIYNIEELLGKLVNGDNYFFSIPCVGQDVLEELISMGIVEKVDVFNSGPFAISRVKIIH